MQRIRQQVDAVFSAVEFRDAIVILPIMDSLHRDIMINVRQYRESSKADERIQTNIAERINKLYQQYSVLADCGFVSTTPLQVDEEFVDIIKKAGGLLNFMG